MPLMQALSNRIQTYHLVLESQILFAITELRSSISETENNKAVQNQADALLTMVDELNRQLKLVH